MRANLDTRLWFSIVNEARHIVSKMAKGKQRFAVIIESAFKLQHIVIWIPQVKVLIVWLTFLLGSFLHDFFPLPGSYFSYKKNIFNVVFVKKGWGWTCGLLLLFIPFNLSYQEADLIKIGKSLLRLVYGTFFWFALTNSFEHVENWSGRCEGDVVVLTKADCIQKRLIWNGFDISGHCFLLTFCILMINEELLAFARRRSSSGWMTNTKYLDFNQRKPGKKIINAVLDSLSLALTMLMILWEFMLFFTCIYFHTIHQKFLGTIIGIAAWYLIYKVAVKYQHPLMPVAAKS